MEQKPVIAGLICEFNPLHFGHAYLLSQMRKESEMVICAMSGPFVQRGEAALLSPWARAEMALLQGADLVLLLPVSFAMSGAERFARGGVSLLAGVGVNTLYFGSECGNAEKLDELALFLLSPAFSSALRPFLARGLSFAVARTEAVRQELGPEMADILLGPNNTLGMEYCKANRFLHTHLSFRTISRRGAAHDEESQDLTQFLSASQLRKRVTHGQSVAELLPPSSAHIFEREQTCGHLSFPGQMEQAVLSFLRRMDQSDFARLPDCSEGIENRLYHAVQTGGTLPQVWEQTKTKRYSLARIRRMTLSGFLGLYRDTLCEAPPFAFVLGATPRGLSYISQRKATLQWLLNHQQMEALSPSAKTVLDQERAAMDQYMLFQKVPRGCGLLDRHPFIKIQPPDLGGSI